jgi:alkylation response protein AidB-like acyl-CoA dehydrogenase
MPDVEITGGDDRFRRDVAAWLADRVVGDFAALRGRGGPGDEDYGFDVRVEWEAVLGRAGFVGLGWPVEHGGRGATLLQQVIWAEEYARARAPARVNHMGENLLAPTLIELGSDEQRARFLPRIRDGTERWCQGYSEPDAGSDLAAVKTTATRDGDDWVLTGQKVWTSLAHVSHWCFVLARTDLAASRHAGLSLLLVPMDQPGVEARRIRQLTGGGEFNAVFFDGARTRADLVVGDVGDGWRVANTLLAFERGVSTLAQQVGFERELDLVVDAARARGSTCDPVIRQRLVEAYVGLRLMRWNALRGMSARGVPGPEASITKLFWATWHRDLANLGLDVLGADGMIGTVGEQGHDLTVEQKLFLFTRADTIYGGSNEIQRNVIGERVLGLPREPR